MKSRYIKYLFATGLITVSTYMSCNKSELEINPPLVTEASYFTTSSEFRTAVMGAYSTLTDYYGTFEGNAALQVFFLPGDDLTADGSNVYDIFTNLNAGEGRLSDVFSRSYVLLNRTNKVLTQLEKAPDGVLTAEQKNSMTGEMLFLRGYAHYILWNVFETAPIMNAEITSVSGGGPSSTTGTQLLDQAIADFAAAAPLLPASWTGAELGRATANSANGMLGKALVFKGTITDANGDYAAALTAFNKITDRSLVANYGDNFAHTKENNAESVFEYQAGYNRNGPGETNIWLANDACACGVAGFFLGMYVEMGATYMGGGRYFATPKLNTAMTGDPRRAYTLNTAGDRITKYSLINQFDGGGGITVNNYRILRYADVLLLKAEALVKSGGSTTEAIGFINDVRTRARNMGGGALPANYSTSETNRTTIMQWIMNERFIELAAEGQRWFDLRRWAKGGDITLNNAFFDSRNSTQMGFVAPKHLDFPIPTSETSKNPNITPNPNYQ